MTWGDLARLARDMVLIVAREALGLDQQAEPGDSPSKTSKPPASM